MNIFTKNRILVGAVILLAAINLAILGTIGFHRTKASVPESKEIEGRPNQSRFIAKELNLTDDQEKQFESLRKQYAKQSQGNRIALSDLYKSIMKELSAPEPNKKLLDSLAIQIGKLHTEQQGATIDHFLTLREMCSLEQYEHLQRLFKRMMAREHMGRKDTPQRRQHQHLERRRHNNNTE